jgi:mRNA interferase RelE/StbE
VNFTVLLHPKAAKELQKIENPIRTRIIDSAKQLRQNPREIGKQLRQSDFWKLRIGEYQAIYQIDSDKNQVIILFVGHRSKVYDNFLKML